MTDAMAVADGNVFANSGLTRTRLCPKGRYLAYAKQVNGVYGVYISEKPAGSDVADPRVRCGKPATIELEDGLWCCPEHAGIIHDSLDRPDKPRHS